MADKIMAVDRRRKIEKTKRWWTKIMTVDRRGRRRRQMICDMVDKIVAVDRRKRRRQRRWWARS